MTSCKTVKMPKLITVRAVMFGLCITACFVSVVFSKTISENIVNTAIETAKTVLPSLFPFMIISSFMSNSGLCQYLEIFPGKFLGKITGIKKEVTGAVVLGLLSGFPVGACTVCEIYKNGSISKDDAENALCAAHVTGPAFPINYIGTYLWGNTLFGVGVYLSQILSMALLSRLFFKKSSANYNNVHQNEESVNYTKALTDAITKSAFSCITICASIVFWKTVCTLLFSKCASGPLFLTLFEFSSAAVAASETGGIYGILMTGFAVGFGGISALFQAAGFTAEVGLSIKKALVFKIMQGIVCALLSLCFYVLFK